jgi:putative FmdB family regulatory protein
MPVYDYFCLECRKRFEVIRRTLKDNRGSAPCPKCGKGVARRWSSVHAQTSKKG